MLAVGEPHCCGKVQQMVPRRLVTIDVTDRLQFDELAEPLDLVDHDFDREIPPPDTKWPALFGDGYGVWGLRVCPSPLAIHDDP